VACHAARTAGRSPVAGRTPPRRAADVPVEIAVGPPVLTINQGSTFMVTDPTGQILADPDGAPTGAEQLGLFADDTRFLSHYAILANGQPWTRLSSAATSYYAA